MTIPLILETERLRLEPVGPEHADGLWRATEVSVTELARWLPWAERPTLESTREFTTRARQVWDDGRGHPFSIIQDGEVCGTVAMHVPIPERRIGELGYWVRTDRTGRGLCTEAGAAVLEFGFEIIGLYRVELRAGVENVASQRVAEKLGFQREGLARQGCATGSGAYDCYLYGVLESDSRPSRERR